ncbi:MAG: glucosaminidase domain-containing protein [Prolixibacteraceae bacterium]|nr:glucosaminidase domain-containing protein [Prolixibacteraceae bacterium]
MKRTEFTFFLVSIATILFSVTGFERQAGEITVQQLSIEKTSQIINIDDSLVMPVLYDTIIVDRFIPISEQKQQFINQVLPAILIVKDKMEWKYNAIQKILKKREDGKQLRKTETRYIDSLMNVFKASSHENLLIRLKPHQTSLVLAQAAVESGWGRSRFAIEGNNLFGVWTGAGDANKLKAKMNRGNRNVFVKRYNSFAESIEHYFLTIGRHRAYRKFRMKRFKEPHVYQLIDELYSYSEKGEAYTRLLKHIIKWNELEKYDNYRIAPEYITPPKDKLVLKYPIFCDKKIRP